MHTLKNIRKTFLHALVLLLPASLFAQGIKITNGCKLIMSGPIKMVLHNANFTNEGTFIRGNSTLLFTGGVNCFIGGNTVIPLQHITVNKAFGSMVNLLQDVTVNGVITMTQSNLMLKNRTLYLEDSGSISGESNQSYITGDTAGTIFVARATLSPLNALNPGNIGVELTSPWAPELIIIQRKHTPVMLSNGRPGIQRHFDIDANNNTSLNATIRFKYLDVELAGQNESELTIWTESDVTNSWVSLGKDNSDPASNWVEKTGLDHWGRFTVADDGMANMLSKPTQAPQENSMAVTDKVLIYPNPLHDLLTMKLVSHQEKDILFTLYDNTGRLLQQRNIHCRAGTNIVRWDISTYASGTYYITTTNSEWKNIKIIKY